MTREEQAVVRAAIKRYYVARKLYRLEALLQRPFQGPSKAESRERFRLQTKLIEAGLDQEDAVIRLLGKGTKGKKR